jgi:mannose/fructose-specific phosphotransferase system component IIA
MHSENRCEHRRRRHRKTPIAMNEVFVLTDVLSGSPRQLGAICGPSFARLSSEE